RWRLYGFSGSGKYASQFSSQAIYRIYIKHLFPKCFFEKRCDFSLYAAVAFCVGCIFGTRIWDAMKTMMRSDASGRAQPDHDPGSRIALPCSRCHVTLINHEISFNKVTVHFHITPPVSDAEKFVLRLIRAIMVDDLTFRPKTVENLGAEMLGEL